MDFRDDFDQEPELAKTGENTDKLCAEESKGTKDSSTQTEADLPKLPAILKNPEADLAMLPRRSKFEGRYNCLSIWISPSGRIDV